MLTSLCAQIPLATVGIEPFLQAYVESDLIGRIIYMSLIVLSLVSWTVLIYKGWISYRVEAQSLEFKKLFLQSRDHPLSVEFDKKNHPETPNAFFMIYTTLKKSAIEFMTKNQQAIFSQDASVEKISEILVPSDFSVLEAQAVAMIAAITKYLERNLYVLSTIVTLAPFLGLLGTVYGILVTFAHLGVEPGSSSTQQILSGLSLALTTTVLGLVNAIPALIGYNALKNKIANFDHEMERFTTEILSAFDAQYRYRGKM